MKNITGEADASLMLKLHKKWIEILKKNSFKVDESFKVDINTSKDIDAFIHEKEGKFLKFWVRVSRGNTQGKTTLINCIKQFLLDEGITADTSYICCDDDIDNGLLFKRRPDYVKTNSYSAIVKIISGAWVDDIKSFGEYVSPIVFVRR